MNKKAIFNFIVIGITAFLMIGWLFLSNDIKSLSRIFGSINYFWISLAFFCMAAYWILDMIQLQVMIKTIYNNISWYFIFKATMIGLFFNSTTPFGSGGQVAQVFVMAKSGIKAGHAASVIFIKSLVHQIMLVLCNLIVFMFSFGYFVKNMHGFVTIFFFVLTMNILVTAFYALIIYNKSVALNAVRKIFTIISKIKKSINTEKIRSKAENEILAYGNSADVMKKNTVLFVKVFLIQFLQFTTLFSIPFVIHIAVEGGGAGWWPMVSTQAIITMTGLIVPLPGSSGGTEIAATSFFRPFFKAEHILPVVIIWRIITYYSGILFSAVFTITASEKPFKSQVNYITDFSSDEFQTDEIRQKTN